MKLNTPVVLNRLFTRNGSGVGRWLLYLRPLVFALSMGACADLPRPEMPDAPTENIALITTTDFSSGFLSVLSLDDYQVYPDLLPVHGDAVVRHDADQGLFFLLSRLGADNITRFIPGENYRREYEVGTGRGSNPYDLVFAGDGSAWLSRYSRNSLWIIDPVDGRKIDTVDLSAYADADGLAEVSALYYHSGYVYAAIQRLNREVIGENVWPPVGESFLVKIDTASRKVVADFTLPFSNPLSRFRMGPAGNSLLIACPGRFSAQYELDGGIVRFHLDTEEFLASPLTEKQAGFEITDFVFVSEDLGFVLTTDEGFNSGLYAFDPTGHTLTTRLAYQPFDRGGYLVELALSADKTRLFLLDRTAENPGVRVFDVTSLDELTDQPLSTGLPPFSISLFEP